MYQDELAPQKTHSSSRRLGAGDVAGLGCTVWEVSRSCKFGDAGDCAEAVILGIIDQTPFGSGGKDVVKMMKCAHGDPPPEDCPKMGDEVRERQARCRTASV